MTSFLPTIYNQYTIMKNATAKTMLQRKRRRTRILFLLGLLVDLRTIDAFVVHHDGRPSALRLQQIATAITAESGKSTFNVPEEGIVAPSQSQHEQFIVHAGRSADMIRRAPALSGITLCKGWSPSATEAFIKAINSCVKMNPILSGHVYEKQNRKVSHSSRKELWIQAGTFPVENHEFCQMIVPPDGLTMSHLADIEGEGEVLQQLTGNYIALFDGSQLTNQQIRKKLPLFGASLMVDGDVAIFSIKMSHAIGDGVTFFELLKQVSLLMSNGGEYSSDIPKIEWNNIRKASHEIYPPTMREKDIETSYGAPFLLGCVKNMLTQPKERREPRMFLLDKNAIAKKKQELRANGGPRVSNNDIITAGVCQANKGADVFVFTENVRGVVEDIPRNAGGNFFWEIPVLRKDSVRPQGLRQMIEHQQDQVNENDFGNGKGQSTTLSPWPFLCGRVARLTSLASITESIVYENVKTICTMPSLSFMKDIPLDVAVIFRYSKSYWGVLHNSYDFDTKSTLLEDAVLK